MGFHVSPAGAAVYSLNLPCLEEDFRDLVNRATDGDTIYLPSCTITLTGAEGDDANVSGDLDITHNIMLKGAGYQETIIQIAGNSDRVIDILVDPRSSIVGGPTDFEIDPLSGNNGQVTIIGVTIQNGYVHQPQEHGAGIRVRHGSTLALGFSVVQKNTLSVENNGGGIYTAGDLVMENSLIRNNKPDYPYFVRNNESLRDGEDGWVGISGGGVYVDRGGTAEITASAIIQNEARSLGGGLAANHGSRVSMDRTTVGENFVGFVDYDELSDDEHYGYGGGVYVGGLATLDLKNVTIADNTAEVEGGGAYVNGSVLALRNSLLQVNHVCHEYGFEFRSHCVTRRENCHGSITSGGNNISDDASCSGLLPAMYDRSSTNADLQGLVNLGHLTYYYPLNEFSPAIDSVELGGCDFLSDQIGQDSVSIYPSRASICDIGAIEYQGEITQCLMR